MSFFGKISESVSHFWHDDFTPWFQGFLSQAVHAEVAALMPIASAAAGSLAGELATHVASGNMSAFAQTAGRILQNTAEQAEAAAIRTGGASLLLAVNTAIANHAAAVPLGGQPVPQMPAGSSVPPVNSDGLRLDGPTLAEYVEKGYKAENYPPSGYAAREEEPPPA